MIKILSILYIIVSSCTASPNGDLDTQNVITVPPNCPPGQEWINGACREVWKFVTAAPSNDVTVSRNCPVGQEYVNGRCREVWSRIVTHQSPNLEPQNVITVPPNCRPGQQWINGQCRDIWKSSSNILDAFFNDLRKTLTRTQEQHEDIAVFNSNRSHKNIISVPNQCPSGFRPDALGICRPILF